MSCSSVSAAVYKAGIDPAVGQSGMETTRHLVLTCNCIFTSGQQNGSFIVVLSNFDDLLTTLDPCRLTVALTLIKPVLNLLSAGFIYCKPAGRRKFPLVSCC